MDFKRQSQRAAIVLGPRAQRMPPKVLPSPLGPTWGVASGSVCIDGVSRTAAFPSLTNPILLPQVTEFPSHPAQALPTLPTRHSQPSIGASCLQPSQRKTPNLLLLFTKQTASTQSTETGPQVRAGLTAAWTTGPTTNLGCPVPSGRWDS